MSPKPGASDSQMVPIEEVERARRLAEECANKREECAGRIWDGIKGAAGGCNTLAWKLFGLGISLCGIVMTGVLIYMSSVSAKADDISRVTETKNEKQDDRIVAIELKVAKEMAEMNANIRAVHDAVLDIKKQKAGP